MNKLFFVLLILSFGCGKDKQLTNNKLERLSSVTSADTTKVSQTGLLLRKSSDDQIEFEDKTYVIGNCSALATTFIDSKPLGGEYRVKFKGEVVGKQIEISEISDL